MSNIWSVVRSPKHNFDSIFWCVFFSGIDKKYAYSPVPTDAFQGGSARFWCDIVAEPSPKIQWIKDNNNLNQLTNDRFVF